MTLSFFPDLKTMAQKVPEKTGGEWQQFLDCWLSKIIWVPETFAKDIHRLPIALSFLNSHLKYY